MCVHSTTRRMEVAEIEDKVFHDAVVVIRCRSMPYGLQDLVDNNASESFLL